jgi:hypothetical protein
MNSQSGKARAISVVPARGGANAELMSRRRMFGKTAEAAFAALLGSGIFGGCAGESRRERAERRASRMQEKKKIWGKLVPPANSSLEGYPITVNEGGKTLEKNLGRYIAEVSQGRPALVVFATHYHGAEEPMCNTPLAVAEKIYKERPGIAVVGITSNLVSPGTLDGLVKEMGLTYPVAAMGRDTYYKMERGTYPGTPHMSAMVVDTSQKAVFCTREYENAGGGLENELLRIFKMVFEGKLPMEEAKAAKADEEGGGRRRHGRRKR